ncbi:conserved virulence factor C family protein [Priestia filamentosa]|uniref:conserved virulence factor C family protein n=1 Tax=Priestia filamentosa TaxID=1402861 RepID=UPI001FB4E03D|nr:conserved virulence factor C family protein [Priestia filamentosa]UOE59509.1 conserved virulence factor C family protein [Priestia filamentosa]
MNIKSIEPTPSPNTMKVTLDSELPAGKSNNYNGTNVEQAPKIIQDLMEIDGVKGVYHVADFLAVERNAKFDWKEILPKVRALFGEEVEGEEKQDKVDEHFGEVNVSLQLFKGIPMQIKLTDGETEKREGLPARFKEAVVKAQREDDNVVLERKWKDHGVRYGDLEEIAKEVASEIDAAYPEERLEELVSSSQKGETKSAVVERKSYKVTLEMFEDEDWTKRYAHLEQMDPTIEDLPLLNKALEDSKVSIRRLATVYLGMIEDQIVLPYLDKALKDKSVTVRRTAADCLSDLGFVEAMPAAIEALEDKSKLVRWRAAMFLYEVGDESALPALKAAEDDPEFEVSMQIKLAIERIQGGEEAKGSVWKQMTEARKH